MLTVSGTTALTLAGGSGDIALGSSGSNLVFTADGVSVTATATVVDSISLPPGRSLEGSVTLLETIGAFSGDVELTDASASAAQLHALNARTSGTVLANAITGITGTAAELQALVGADGLLLTTAWNATMTGPGASAGALGLILDATTGSVSARLETSYTSGAVLVVAAGDAVDVDPEGRFAPLQPMPVADSFDIDAPGEWHLNANSGLFTWYEGSDGADGLNAIFLYGAGAITVSGSVVTVAATAAYLLL